MRRHPAVTYITRRTCRRSQPIEALSKWTGVPPYFCHRTPSYMHRAIALALLHALLMCRPERTAHGRPLVVGPERRTGRARRAAAWQDEFADHDAPRRCTAATGYDIGVNGHGVVHGITPTRVPHPAGEQLSPRNLGRRFTVRQQKRALSGM